MAASPTATRTTDTMQEVLGKILRQISDAKAMPDSDLEFLVSLETMILQELRSPADQGAAQAQMTGAAPGPMNGGAPMPGGPMGPGGGMGLPPGMAPGGPAPMMGNPDEMARMLG